MRAIAIAGLALGLTSSKLSAFSWKSSPQKQERSPPRRQLRDITLYQFQTCPFCNKVRVFLDYHSLPYTLIEVEPVFRNEIKSYGKKVPLLTLKEATTTETECKVSEEVSLNESSLIVSSLKSFLVNEGNVSIGRILSYYPEFTRVSESTGKENKDYHNKYMIMYEDSECEVDQSEISKWREFGDRELVHTISPNIYRTISESLRSFDYITAEGKFEGLQAYFAKYIGAFAMYFVGKRLKKRHALKDDVRQSLYDSVAKWMREINSTQPFHGGEHPDLADLELFGILSCFQGTDAFHDLTQNTKLLPWFNRMKAICDSRSKLIEKK